MPELPKIEQGPGFEVPGAPQVPRSSPLAEGLQEFGNKLTTVALGVQRMQIANQSSQADADYVAKEADLEFNTFADSKKMSSYMAMPIQQGLKAFTGDVQSQVDQLKKTTLAANSSIANELGPQLNIRSNEGMLRLRSRFLAAFDANQRAQFAGPTMQATVNGILSAQDPRDAMQLEHSYREMIHNAPGMYENEKAGVEASFDKALAIGRAQQIIAGPNPGGLDDFLEKNEALISPEEALRLRAQATTAISQPLRELNARHAALEAQAVQGFEQQLQTGTLKDADVIQAVNSGTISQQHGEQLLHRRIKMSLPPDPDSVNALISHVKDLDSPDELKYFDLAAVSSNPNLNEADKGQVRSEIAKREKFLRTEIGRATIQAKNLIQNAYQKPGPTDPGFVVEKLHPGAREQALRNAEAEFQMRTLGVSDPAKIHQAAMDAIAHNPMPKLEEVAPKASPVPVPVTPGVAERMLNWFRNGTMPRKSDGLGTTSVTGPEE